MKVLVATPLFPPEAGGPATYSKILYERLPEHGFSVMILPFREVRKFPKILRHIIYFFKVLNRGRKADIIYAQDPVSVGLPAMLAAKVLRKRFLLKIVGDYAWEQGAQRFDVKDTLDVFAGKTDDYHFAVLLLKKVQTFVAKQAEKIIVPSKYLKSIVAKWGIDGKKIHVIYNSFEKLPEPGNKRTMRGLLQFDGKLLISVGRLVPWKGFDMLIKLVPEIVKEIPNFKLLIIGGGPEMERLQKIVDRLKINDHVSIAGAVEKDVLLRYIEVSDAFALNTSYEGFSHQLLEVMALGVPVVTTNIGGNPELIEDGVHGVLLKPNDKKAFLENILKVLKNARFKNQLIRGGLKRVSDFSEVKMVKETIEVLKA